MNRYEKGKIYKVVDVGYNLCYIGSTVETLGRRMAKHRDHYKRYKEGNHNNVKVFDLFDKVGVENCKIELIENYPCNSKEELHAKEGQYIKECDCVNKQIAGRTKEQWIKDNADLIQEGLRKYREENKDKIKQIGKKYREEHPDKVNKAKQKWKENNPDRYKQYFKDYNLKNKEHKQEISKVYREREKDKIALKKIEYKEKHNIPINCSCGAIVSKFNFNKHTKTKRHHQYLQSLATD